MPYRYPSYPVSENGCCASSTSAGIDLTRTYWDTCPQTGRYGQRFSVVGMTGGLSMTETWLNMVANVFGPTGMLGVHTNCTFWDAQLLDGNIATSAIAIRRSDEGLGPNIDIYPRYINVALGNNRATTAICFFMASDQTDAAIREILGLPGFDAE